MKRALYRVGLSGVILGAGYTAAVITITPSRHDYGKAAGDRFRAQIAALSPEERAAPAFVFGNQELVPAGTPDAMAVVRADPAFYRARGSPFEARAVLVEMPNTEDELKAQHWQLYRELNWAAVKRLVNP